MCEESLERTWPCKNFEKFCREFHALTHTLKHVAVTWTVENNGETKIYKNGMLMARAESGQTTPIDPGGSFVLGGEQDCYGGCFEGDQSYNGLMVSVYIEGEKLVCL